MGVWHAMYWQTWAVFDLNSKISPQIHHLTKTSSVKCVPFYFLYSLLCSVWFHTGRPHSNSWQLAEELQFLQVSDLCDSLLHKCMPFLVHLNIPGCLRASLILVCPSWPALFCEQAWFYSSSSTELLDEELHLCWLQNYTEKQNPERKKRCWKLS